MKFLEFVGKNLNRLINSFRVRIMGINLPFDEDVFSDTVVKCSEKLQDKPLTEQEFTGYFWTAFKTNTLRELKYMRNNTTNEIPEISSEDNNDGIIDEKFKEVSDIIQNKFGKELYELFLMHANGMSYEKLNKITEIPNLKYQFRKIRDYVRSNY